MLEMKAQGIGAVLLSVTACGDPGQLGRSVVAPSDLTANVALGDVPVRGADVTVERTDGSSFKGELLAASEKDAVVLTDGKVVRVTVDETRRVAIRRYDNALPIAVLATWAVLGAAGGVSHGILASFTEPIWAGVSVGAIVPIAADEGRFAYTERQSDFAFLHEYARFPQGLPAQFRKRASSRTERAATE